MPPPITFDKKKIIEVALKYVTENGIESVSARKIARQLKSSIIPIYSNFKSIDDLKFNIVKKSIDLMNEYLEKKFVNDPLIDFGIGFVTFVRDYPKLFQCFFLQSSKYKNLFDKFHEQQINKLKSFPAIKKLNKKEVNEFVDVLRILGFGIGCFVAAGQIEQTSDVQLGTLVKKVFNPFIQKYVAK